MTAVILGAVIFAAPSLAAEGIPEDFPRFIVPGHDRQMDSLRRLFHLHYSNSGPMATLWEEWLSKSTLWPAVGAGDAMQKMRQRWAQALLNRPIDSEGYVSTVQHDGLAHSDGWPFPLWHQGKGVGWHFAGTGIAGYDGPLVKPDDWKLNGARGGEITAEGWTVELTGAGATAQPPVISLDPRHAPFLRLNWRSADVSDANPFVEWTTTEHPEFSPDRRMHFSPPLKEGENRTMIPVYRLASWKGPVASLRINFGNAAPAKIVIKSFHSAYDSRHSINNTTHVRGCRDYFMWTGDVSFLLRRIEIMRLAMRWMMSEFDTRNRKCVYTTWVGHEGRSGIKYGSDGGKAILPGEGIGGNYWDLLPCGGEDTLATIYYLDALRDLAEIERVIREHPQWNIPASAMAFDPDDLLKHADEVQQHSSRRFWNEKTGRFVLAIDLDGNAHDYGFTFVNCEAIYYGLASDEQAKSILSWLSGERVVEGDTSAGDDIYHWRFAPRSTTRRNIDYYFWAWSSPESIPWGGQVQDGGAVLGFSYHDLMSRLMTRGPDDAWQRLEQILAWFDEVQSEGGYREYYMKPDRGTLQGSNTAGGLGLDAEFFESIMVPQVMLYGFLGFQPTPDGCRINPRLPSDWPELTITRIHLHDRVMDVRVVEKTVEVRSDADLSQMQIAVPQGWEVRRL